MALEFVASKLAEAVVCQVVQTITDLLQNEASALSSVKADVESLRRELMLMQSFLKDAETKQAQDERVRIWVTQVRDVACEIEDAIETYIYKVHSSYFKAFRLPKLKEKIQTVKENLEALHRQRQAYQIELRSGEGTSSSLRNSRRSYPDDEEDEVIMLKGTTAALKAQLMAEEDRLRVVSIVGMGGLGKTTLAKRVYNDIDVRKHFDCCAWVFVSQQCSPREVWVEILMQVGFQPDQREATTLGNKKYTRESLEKRKGKRDFLNGLEDHELFVSMRSELREKRYLIVLDDIWSTDAWNGVHSAFPDGKSGSKVMLTTRIETVASSADPHFPPIRPPLLTTTESWELLKRKAFPRETFSELGFPLELEEQGKKILDKCGGLPLAIVVLGGFLKTKFTSVDEWVNLLKDVNINKLKSKQQYRVEDILELSFQDLPYHLKPCFLYLASFPEDSEIPKGRLVRLWIAEGFVPTVGKEDIEGTSEEIGERYLGELVDRCMVQVSKKDRTGKGMKSCRMHDLMRDLCISKAKEELFLENVQLNEETRSRRIAIHVNPDLDWVEHVHSNLRSVMCSTPILSLKKKNFLLLRVLELDFQRRQSSCKLPKGAGNLVHLRYLKVCGAEGLILPNSIGNLRNLQTLDVGDCWNVMLPSTMSRLRRLRHLFLPYVYRRPRCAMGVLFENVSLKRIVTLKWIKAKDLIRDNEVLPLSNICVLGITDFRSDKEVTLVLESLSFHSRLGNLQSLHMHYLEGEFPNLELLCHCHVLSRLTLLGHLSGENITYLPKTLVKVHLFGCSFDQEKIAVMEKLPNLRILRLSIDRNDTEYKLVFSVGGFPKLEHLVLFHLRQFTEWEVEEGAMPNLKSLDIYKLRKLRMIPEGLKRVTTLRELNIRQMPKEFEDRLRVNEDGIEGEDFYKVRQIPSITFSHTL